MHYWLHLYRGLAWYILFIRLDISGCIYEHVQNIGLYDQHTRLYMNIPECQVELELVGICIKSQVIKTCKEC